jgi:hypothetical protein
MFFGDHDEAAGAPGDCVRQPARQVIVVAAPELVLDDELGAIFAFGNDVDPPATCR